jgi:hypothetical protein
LRKRYTYEEAKGVQAGKNSKVGASTEPCGDVDESSDDFRPLESLTVATTC